MEAPESYFDPDTDYDTDTLMEINEHIIILDDIKHAFLQLLDELYDEVECVDHDVVHGLVDILCKQLEIKTPHIESLKIKDKSCIK